MGRIDWKVIVIVAIILSVAFGFLFGTGILGGSSPAAGSAEDPLISSEAAQQTIDQRVASLEAEIDLLTEQQKTLETTLTDLYNLVNSGAATPATPSTGGETKTEDKKPSGSTDNVGKTGVVTSDVVNMRASASTSATVLKKLSPSDTFTITKVDGDWYQVQLSDGTTGWVAAYLVKVK